MTLDPDDFLFVLAPGRRYWFVVRGDVWGSYRKVLKAAFGKSSFRTFKTEEETVKTSTGRRVEAVWVAIEVGDKPILVSADIMGVPTDYKAGDNAQSTGSFDQDDEPHWILTAEQYTQAVDDWARTTAKEIGEAPEEFMNRIEERASRITWLLVVGGLGALAIYRATK